MNQLKLDVVSVHAVMPYVHVADVERSIDFYRLLGFEVVSRWPFEGHPGAAFVESGTAKMLLAPASAPIDPAVQAALLYMYVADVVALRRKLMTVGITVTDVTFPDYMPKGEIGVVDPDGYCVLIGQLR
jgi:catechol 2,3-dioxygenase-like lactoylglutathione lyase family enzyme